MGLEINERKNFHKNAIYLNSGRNSFELLIKKSKIKKVYLPYYTCDVLLDSLKKNNVEWEFFHIGQNFLPVNLPKISLEEGIVLNNYFGLMDNLIRNNIRLNNVIIDSAQAFYSKVIGGLGTFYSPRKFFGVSDGGIAISKDKLVGEFPQDVSYDKFDHLLKRIDLSAEEGFQDYKLNEKSLYNQPIKATSELTRKMLLSIDYKKVSKIRRENFSVLHHFLKKRNKLQLLYEEKLVPFGYPLLVSNGKALKEHLIKNKIYVPTLWPNVKTIVPDQSFEANLIDNLVLLPIDQRYGKFEMEYILKIINNG